ncbi:hypothetical protein C7S16_1266 [Burkholderia thailandensis]|uniref:Uncharacterized protein n=1 Tax=Burkholderia thailandensis TaxID=57975 RepID=A0AAW9CUS6_BURTH|nr:hypothetical protein [Burkholderia thailandensis]
MSAIMPCMRHGAARYASAAMHSEMPQLGDSIGYWRYCRNHSADIQNRR